MAAVSEIFEGSSGKIFISPDREIQQEHARVKIGVVGPATELCPVGHAVERRDIRRASVGYAHCGKIPHRQIKEITDAPPDDEVAIEIEGPIRLGRQHTRDVEPRVRGSGDARHGLREMLDLLPQRRQPMEMNLGVVGGRFDLFPILRTDPHVAEIEVHRSPRTEMRDDRPDCHGQGSAKAVIGCENRRDAPVGHGGHTLPTGSRRPAAARMTDTTRSCSSSVISWKSGRMTELAESRSVTGSAGHGEPAYAGSRWAAMMPRRADTPESASRRRSSSRRTGKPSANSTQNAW